MLRARFVLGRDQIEGDKDKEEKEWVMRFIFCNFAPCLCCVEV